MEFKVKDVTKVIEEFAPLSIQEKWDNSGLCIGSPDSPVTSVLLGLDCTPELVDEAVECGADMIVTHHPLIFSGLKKISPDDMIGKAVFKAIKAGISIYAAHTNADKVIAGVSGAMAAKLGLKDVEILSDEGEGTGLGVVGNLPEPLTVEQAVELVKNSFSLSALRASRPLEGKIERVAMCGGSGGSLIAAAKAASAHGFISKLPDGYETWVGSGGQDLSGGERQRVSIARTIIQNPKILILDEATAAMDTETERNIQNNIFYILFTRCRCNSKRLFVCYYFMCDYQCDFM